MNDIHGGDWAGFETEYGKKPLDFSMNISPLGMPARAVEAAKKALEEPPAYPDPLCRRLCGKLAAYHGVSEEQIVCGTGAAELIWRLVQTVRPGKALIPVPAFSEYERALEAFGCEIRYWPIPAPGFSVTAELADRITPDTDMLFLCEPNNPTGRLTDPDVMKTVRNRCEETGCLLVVDECFMEFVEEPQKYSSVPFLREPDGRSRDVKKAENLIVLRAFTKTYAMAGLRIGYVLCGNAGLAGRLRKTGQPWPVSAPAEAAGLAALEETAYLRRLRDLVKTERTYLEKELRSFGFRVIPGEADYILFYSEETDLAERLRSRGILLRDCSAMEGLGKGWYRTAVRNHEDNRELIRQIAGCLGKTCSDPESETPENETPENETPESETPESETPESKILESETAGKQILPDTDSRTKADRDSGSRKGTLPLYVRSGTKQLRCGFTTGTCAALAAAGAAELLLKGAAPETVKLVTPKGIEVEVVPETVFRSGDTACCSIIKDAGDDPDVTDGMTVMAAVSRIPKGFEIDGGDGVGKVTRPGLDQPVGAAAINSVPRRMIRAAAAAVCEETGYPGGLRIVISIPGGEERARQTFNPHLGIEGGLSVLGTSGIVEPMSEQALVETIALEIRQAACTQRQKLILTPGNYGLDFLKQQSGCLSRVPYVRCSNYIGDAVDMTVSGGFREILLVGHIGKLVKLAAGIMNTHSHMADGRREIFCAHAAACGAPAEICRGLMAQISTDGCLEVLDKADLREPVMQQILLSVQEHLDRRASGKLRIGAVLFSNVYGMLGMTPEADNLIREWEREMS